MKRHVVDCLFRGVGGILVVVVIVVIAVLSCIICTRESLYRYQHGRLMRKYTIVLLAAPFRCADPPTGNGMCGPCVN